MDSNALSNGDAGGLNVFDASDATTSDAKQRATLEAPPGIAAGGSTKGKNGGTKDSCGAGCTIF